MGDKKETLAILFLSVELNSMFKKLKMKTQQKHNNIDRENLAASQKKGFTVQKTAKYYVMFLIKNYSTQKKMEWKIWNAGSGQEPTDPEF